MSSSAALSRLVKKILILTRLIFQVVGLCGNYNSDMRDDFQTPTGGIPESSALLFVDSWKMKDTCPKPTDVTVSLSVSL